MLDENPNSAKGGCSSSTGVEVEHPTTECGRSRSEILSEIGILEARLGALRAILPSALKHFFLFRSNRQKYVLTYAATQSEARAKVDRRLTADYGEGEYTVRFDKAFSDAESANASHPLFSSLSPADRIDFLRDWQEEQRLKPPSKYTTHLESEIAGYVAALAREESNRREARPGRQRVAITSEALGNSPVQRGTPAGWDSL